MELNEEQLDRLDRMGQWICESRLNFRKDKDFLLMFLRSCDFDLDLSKKTMHLYYENRKDNAEEWTNRDLNLPELNAICRNKLSDEDSSRLTEIRQVYTLSVDVGMRRLNCQLNGTIGIFDFRECPLWAMLTAMRPYDGYYMLKVFGNALPVRTKAIVFLNCTGVCYATIKTLLFFSPSSLKDRIHCFGSDLSKLGEVVPLELLPEEYGGSAGPFQKHQDDAKYGL